jgi:enoyl-CoA hydratase/carnithine racemase
MNVTATTLPASDDNLEFALKLEADRMVRCTRTEDHREAVQAFIGKRKPTFQPRPKP